MTSGKKGTTGQILKASVIMGGTSAVSMITGIIRSKVMAILLGPEGIGLLGLLQSILNTASTVSGMGLASSGVRQIAEARANGDAACLALTRKALLWSAVILGLLGAALLVILRNPIAEMTVGNDSYAWMITWVSAGVWATTIYNAQIATLNGMRRLVDLARAYIISALGGTLVTVLAVWQLKESGVVIAVLSIPLTLLVVSWWLTRKLPTIDVHLSWQAISRPLFGLFSLGFAFMVTNLFRVATLMTVRVTLTQSINITAAGYYQAAYSISALYLGFVLEAMSKDYYPRLTAVAKDHKKTNAMVNEQAEVALLMSGPVILGMLTLTPQVVGILYSGAFVETVDILRWQLLGDLFKVASWTMGFILLSQGRSQLFLFTEFSWNLMYLGVIWVGLPVWNLKATGVAYFLTHAFYFILLWVIVSRVNHFRWSKTNLVLLLTMLVCAAVISWARLLPGIVPLALGLILTVAMSSYSFVRICRSLGGLPWKRNMHNH
ncbi:MAG: colanic acid exporter [Pelotomaculum sp. PtaB.Bin104]|nr:MAG: colanic acid exporter [Pelotomaculum sp. PtaB.Bin104]